MSAISYRSEVEGLAAPQLEGFFVGWPEAPSGDMLLEILRRSSHTVVAIDDETNRVVGFVNCISDGILSAYIPLLEVLPAFQHRGIGSSLLRRLLDEMPKCYMVDLVCDESMVPFYEPFGLRKGVSMIRREYPNQQGLLPSV